MRRVRAAPVGRTGKSGEVIDLLRAHGLPDALSARDHAAVKRTGLSPAQIVEAFEAAYRGRWGDAWLRDNLCVRLVVERWAGYQARRHSTATDGRRSDGTSAALLGPAVAGDDRLAAFEKYG